MPKLVRFRAICVAPLSIDGQDSWESSRTGLDRSGPDLDRSHGKLVQTPRRVPKQCIQTKSNLADTMRTTPELIAAIRPWGSNLDVDSRAPVSSMAEHWEAWSGLGRGCRRRGARNIDFGR